MGFASIFIDPSKDQGIMELPEVVFGGISTIPIFGGKAGERAWKKALTRRFQGEIKLII